jgi:alkanesulfonate monooxygenase SsuD/methylene tetrahydromethanopterin reductase-like flavin-dependent oxidoreductase (luciferase family)
MVMEIGIGLDATLNLSFAEQADVSKEAARLGYTSIWTPEGAGQDSFQLCSQRWAASCQVIPEGLTTGIGVSPVLYRTPIAFAMSGGTVSQLTRGRFIMGIGAGGAYRPRTRQSLGLPRFSTLALMRDYLVTVHGLVAGDEVNYQGEVITLKRAKLAISPPPHTPVYLGALGPEMLRLGGELADGICLNWCTPEQIAWSRERIAEGAARVDRDPSSVQVVEYIRVCVDDDVDVARRAFARSTMGYALGQTVPTERERQLGYRAHFERMGYTKALAELDRMRQRGAEPNEVADAFPPELLKRVGYYGTPEGAAAAFRRLAEALDVAIVRVVAARPGMASVLAALQAWSIPVRTERILSTSWRRRLWPSWLATVPPM